MNQLLFENRQNYGEICEQLVENRDFASLVYAAYHMSRPKSNELKVSAGYICSTAAAFWAHAVKTMPDPDLSVTLQEITLHEVFCHSMYNEISIAQLPLSIVIDTLYGLCYEVFIRREERQQTWLQHMHAILKALRGRVKQLLFEVHPTTTLDVKHLCYPPSASKKLLYGGGERGVTELAPNGVLLLETLFYSLEYTLFQAEFESWDGVHLVTSPPLAKEIEEAWTRLRCVSIGKLTSALTPSFGGILDNVVHANQNRVLFGVRPEQVLLQMNEGLLKDTQPSFDQLVESCTKEEFESMLPLVYDTTKVEYSPTRGLYKRGPVASPYLLTILVNQ